MKKDSLHKILDEAIKRIISVVNPVKIILFGSAANDKIGANSDIDLLVIVPSGFHRRKTAQKIYRNFIGLGFAADIIVVRIPGAPDRPAPLVLFSGTGPDHQLDFDILEAGTFG